MARSPVTDVAIVGGGLVGMVAAAALADLGCDVVVIDPVTQLPVHDEPYDLRTFALTPASRAVLESAGVWPRLDHARVSRFEGIEVRDAGSRGVLRFSRPAAPQPPLAWLVEQSNLVLACQQALAARAGVAGQAGMITGIVDGVDGCTLRFADRAEVRARIVLGCDGGDSPLRTLCGISCETQDYHQHAIVANVVTAQPHEGIARQRFRADGPLALLPLPSPDAIAVVWTTTPEHAAWAQGCTDDAFRAALAQAADYWLGEVLATSRRVAFPLRRQHAVTYAQGRVALLGDAAHIVHPLAGQGLNLGFADVAGLIAALRAGGREAVHHPQSSLRRYARARRGDNLAMLTLTDVLNGLFVSTNPAAAWLRGAGLTLTDRIQPLKQRLVAHAVGAHLAVDAGLFSPLAARPGREPAPTRQP